jgi:IS30 family transposase
MNKLSRFRRLSLLERERIGNYKAEGRSGRDIAKILGRSHTTISRELKRNNHPHQLMRGYIGCLAHGLAKIRKSNSGKRPRLKNDFIRNYVDDKLLIGWSPEQIAHRLSMEHAGYSISTEAIYQYIYIDYPEGIKYLARRHPKRYPKHYSRKRHRSLIPNRISIIERPESINNRRLFGHWESDSIESQQSSAAVNVILERKSRLVKLNKLSSKHADKTHKAICWGLAKLPKKARQSITYDNGTENCRHEKTNAVLESKSYFCLPYHSWEKGAVENINSLIRRFLPKKTDFAKVTYEQLQMIENLLNNRPRKCLGFKTPLEVFNRYCYNTS